MPRELEQEDELIPPYDTLAAMPYLRRVTHTTVLRDLRTCQCNPCIMMIYLTVVNLVLAVLGFAFYATTSIYFTLDR